MIFTLEVRPPHWFFAQNTKISLKYASNLDNTPAYRLNWILLVLDTNKDWTYLSLHQEFQVIWRDRCQSRIVVSYPCNATFSYEANSLKFWLKYLLSPTSFYKTNFTVLKSHSWPDEIKYKTFGICYFSVIKASNNVTEVTSFNKETTANSRNIKHCRVSLSTLLPC